MDKTLINQRRQLEKASNGKNVGKGTKSRKKRNNVEFT